MADTTPEQQLFAAAGAGDEAAVDKLIAEVDCNVAWQNEEGTSPLMIAAENGHQVIVGKLLQAGAPWNAQDNTGYCAGEYATASRNQDIVELLLEWGVRAEMLLGAADRQAKGAAGAAKVANEDYLKQKLVYRDGILVDAQGEAVMMGWEAPLMERHAEEICANRGDILNVGFGLGIIDEAIQRRNPASHTIIEAHPDVHAHMLSLGWDKRPGVRILFGRWQDVLPQLQTYDGIFFDTYGEGYEELRDFHCQLPALLKPTGIYSYFNGLASDNFFFHLVYGRVVQVELHRSGIEVSFKQESVQELGDEVWQGINKYWHFSRYFLPVASKKSMQPTAAP